MNWYNSNLYGVVVAIFIAIARLIYLPHGPTMLPQIENSPQPPRENGHAQYSVAEDISQWTLIYTIQAFLPYQNTVLVPEGKTLSRHT